MPIDLSKWALLAYKDDTGLDRMAEDMRAVRSRTFMALLIYVAVQLFILAIYPDAKKHGWLGLATADSSTAESAIRSVATWQQHPTSVVMGASYMWEPFGLAEIERYRTSADIEHIYTLHCLEDKLTAIGYRGTTVQLLSTALQTVSDDYILTNEYLVGDRRPNLLILGVTPRDFSDFDIPSPANTMIFHTVVDLRNYRHYAAIGGLTLTDLSECLSQQYWPLWCKRSHLQHKLAASINGLLLRLGCPMAKPKEDTWAASLKDYQRHYTGLSVQSIKRQLCYLDALLRVCTQRDIKVLLVIMPVHKTNEDLMPMGFYSRYQKVITDAAHSNGANVLNLAESSVFNRSDFLDNCHLNASGGLKLIDQLAPDIREMTSGRNAHEPQSARETK